MREIVFSFLRRTIFFQPYMYAADPPDRQFMKKFSVELTTDLVRFA